MLTSNFSGFGPDEADDDDVNEAFTGVPINHDFAPYGNKTVRSQVYLLKTS